MVKDLEKRLENIAKQIPVVSTKQEQHKQYNYQNYSRKNALSRQKRPSKEQLEKDYEEARSLRKIGEKYSVSPCTVLKWMRKFEINQQKFLFQISKEKKLTIEKLKKDYEEIKVISKLAKKYNVSRQTIYTWLKKARISVDRRSIPSRDELLEKYRKLKKMQRIAEQYGVTVWGSRLLV